MLHIFCKAISTNKLLGMTDGDSEVNIANVKRETVAQSGRVWRMAAKGFQPCATAGDLPDRVTGYDLEPGT